MRSRTVLEIQVDERLVGKFQFFSQFLEIGNSVLVKANGLIGGNPKFLVRTPARKLPRSPVVDGDMPGQNALRWRGDEAT